MSVINTQGLKVLLPRIGPDDFWTRVLDEYAAEQPRRWRDVAMLALRENAGWPLERIGLVFGHTRGHVARCLDRVKAELRERYDVDLDAG
jgi:hypothetical protein